MSPIEMQGKTFLQTSLHNKFIVSTQKNFLYYTNKHIAQSLQGSHKHHWGSLLRTMAIDPSSGLPEYGP
jgi:hypothetical protein